MGVKDHLEDGTGHILSLGLDLDYLHVNGAEQQAGLSTRMGAGNIETLQSITAAGNHSSNSTGGSCTSLCTHSSSSGSSWSNFSEESVDSDDELPHNVSDSVSQNLEQDQPPLLHLQESSTVCQTVRLDLTPDKYPEDPSQEETLGLNDPVTECRNKVEFALKLGYSEELVVMVLRKLGPDALINDMLGELVKLGTKTDTEQQGGLIASQFTFSPLASSSTNSSLASCLSSQPLQDKENLRPVVVDGSNVAMSHGNKEVFSCQGIRLAVDWFLERGHRDITVFVPAWRKEQSRPDALITDQEILRRLEKDKILVFTPSRRVQGRRVVCYDDRFIVKLAYESDGIIVSNDNYRDLANEKPEWKKFIDERLLMYSFVNDKFMPPDDPLGRHGPNLENFLRKRPVFPEHRKQPCPYGKKCTYGHKCKFYHPERGSQPQRAVADELRASAKSSSVASKGVLKDALIVKSLSSGEPEAMVQPEQSWDTPKMQPAPSPQNSILEDSLQVHSKLQGCRESNSSSNSSCSSSILGHFTPAGPPLSGRLDPWEQRGACDRGSSRVAGATGSSLADACHRCESPDMGYSSLVKAYSSLSLVVPQSPECFFPADLRGGSLLSDCSSEGSVSSDSFSPDPLIDVGPKCHHQYHHPHHHRRHHHRLCSGQYTQPASHVPPGLGQHVPFSYPIPQELWEKHSLGLDDHPSSSTSYASPHALKPPPAYFPPHSQHLFLNNFPGEFQTCPPHPSQTSTAHIHSQSSPLHRNVMGSLWKDGRFQDSQLYKGSTIHSRRNHCELNQKAQHQVKWDTHSQQSPKSCYDLFSYQSLPKAHEKAWPSPLDRQIHSSPRALSASSLPPSALLSFPSISTPKSHLQPVPQHQESPVLGQYQDHRERMFLNLCRIFSPDLVRMVMIRNPHVLDAQELAAAILLEKSQHAS